jgi:hypothetical protein
MATIRELKYFAGLDVGQAHQFTALAILERSQAAHDDIPDRESRSYAVRHLERWPVGTPYTAIRDRLVELFNKSPLRHTQLVVDVTAVGRPVLDLLRRGGIKAQVKPIAITTGHRASHEDGGWLVPKKELVSVLQVLLQARRLKIAPGLPEADVLLHELTPFQAKPLVPTADPMLDWRENLHDDLVLSIAVAVWLSERLRQFWASVPVLLDPGLAPLRPW